MHTGPERYEFGRPTADRDPRRRGVDRVAGEARRPCPPYPGPEPACIAFRELLKYKLGGRTDMQIQRWEDGPLSEAAIRERHRPAASYRISPYKHEVGTRFRGAMRSGRVYVLSGRCSFSFDHGSARLGPGEFCDLPRGEYEFETEGEAACLLVLVWDLGAIFRSEGSEPLSVSVVDPGMDTALNLAREFGEPTCRPIWLTNVALCANLVLKAEEVAMPIVMLAWQRMREDGYSPDVLKQAFAESFGQLSRDPLSAPDVSDQPERMNILLRLWSGCISAAKMIATGTQSGPNTPELRAQAFRAIDTISREDAFYKAGVVAAPTFKRSRSEVYSFEGVPADSPVRICP